MSFAEPGGVPAEIASCGSIRSMNLRPDFHVLPLEERVRAVMAEWQGELPRLLVFDNCEVGLTRFGGHFLARPPQPPSL